MTFRNFKNSIMEAPLLALPPFGEEFLLETDASDKGLGTILSQQIEGNKGYLLLLVDICEVEVEEHD